MARKIPIDVVRLAGGYKASREGKDRSIATQEMLATLPTMGFEVDYSASKEKKDPPQADQPFEPLSVM